MLYRSKGTTGYDKEQQGPKWGGEMDTAPRTLAGIEDEGARR